MLRARPSNSSIFTDTLARASKRRRSREWVLRALYAAEVGAPEPEAQLEVLLVHDPPPECDLDFARRLFAEARAAADGYDAEIGAGLENWDLSRLALIDHLILRLALVEWASFPDIPENVTLNEMIELAKRYSDGRAAGFINGVLAGLLRRRAEAAGRPRGTGAGE
jgi:N utilization substance protein B